MHVKKNMLKRDGGGATTMKERRGSVEKRFFF